MSDNEAIYAVNPMSLAEDGILKGHHDVIAQKAGVISPKYISDSVYASLIKLGITYWEAKTTFYIIACFLLAIALLNLCIRLKVHSLTLCMLFLLLGVYNDAASMPLLSSASILTYFMMPTALSFLAISFCFGDIKRYNLALIIASITALVHLHYGLFSALVIGIFFFIDCYIDKKIDFTVWKGGLIYIAAMLVTALPTVLSDISLSRDMVKVIYKFWLRGMLPKTSFTGAYDASIIHFQIVLFIFYAFIVFIYRSKNAVQEREALRDKLIAAVLPVSYIVVLFLAYIGGDVIKSLTVAKLAYFKYFPYVSFVVLVFFLKYFDEKVSKGEYFIAAPLFVVVGFSRGFAYLMLPFLLYEAYVFIQRKKPLKRTDYKTIVCFVCVFFFWCLVLKHLKVNLLFNISANDMVFIIIVISLYLLFKAKEAAHFKLAYGACLFTLILLAYMSRSGFSIVKQLRSTATPEIYNISIWLKKNTSAEDKIFTDRGGWVKPKVYWIPILAHRDIYVSAKQIPATNYATVVWEERTRLYTAFIKGRPFNTVPPEESSKFMSEIECKYLLMASPNQAYFDTELFKPLLTEGEYTLFERID